MAKNSRGKRPCSICRKWFVPDVRQKGRQRTCSPACSKELHRRQCKVLNDKNKKNNKSDYLQKKLDEIPEPETDPPIILPKIRNSATPVLPMDVIISACGVKYGIIIQYVAAQVFNQACQRPPGLPHIAEPPSRLNKESI